MASNLQILSDLKVIMDANQRLELLTTYKGVPFVCKAKVEKVETNSAQLRTLDPSIFCLLHESQAKVLGSDYFEPAIAKIVQIDVKTGLLELSDFSYIATRLGERMIVRVEPSKPIEVTLENAGLKIIAQLVDISISGMGVSINFAHYSAILKPGATVQVRMEIPTGSVNLNTTILSAYKAEGHYRLSMRFAQDGSQRSLIFRYLIDRRSEIENEVQEEYHKFTQAANK